MNAAVVESFSTPPRYTTFNDPTAAEGELIVRVVAAGLHPIVKSLANGSHYGSTGVLPFVPGVDGVGHLEDGTRVYFGVARSPFGSFAERTVTRKDFLVPLPGSCDSNVVAATANPGMSSWVALKERAKFISGESVLILGATGSAGQLAIQIAKRLGARHIVAVGRNVNFDALHSLGADSVISLQQDRNALIEALRKEWTETGIDIVLDYLWGEPAEAVLEAIARKGLQHSAPRVRYVQIGGSAGPTITLPAATLRSSGLELLGSGFGSASMEEIFRSLAEFFAASAAQPFQANIRPVALKDVEALWNTSGEHTRLIFQP
ncbi:quinone oxidoreductase family protein [Edaphobacter flagellatus]|uniref:quinone oxidoreductase family protein n=1 Tax=Edaphobacter flagellatus TaxID=1933044 RepID=UPI0021B181D2|nr:zinc-binding alcohol dehydrogenase family protein [Edaphobacter flagellatus]